MLQVRSTVLHRILSGALDKTAVYTNLSCKHGHLMFKQLLSRTNFMLAALFQAVEDEFLAITSKSERYLDVWDGLTPYSAVDLVLRQRSDFDWLREGNIEQYDAELSAYIDIVRPAVVALQWVVNEAKAVDTAFDIETRRETWLRTPVDTIARCRDPANLDEVQHTYERMLTAALTVRLRKLSGPPEVQRVIQTRESSLAIDQIRASEYSKETAFIFDSDRLPDSLRQGICESKCLAVTVPDAWIAKCDAYVDFSAPSFGLVDTGRTGCECVLQLASGAVLLEASEVSRFLGQFGSELPVVFVGKETSALAVHEFSGLADCAAIHRMLAHFGELDGLIPVLTKRLNLDDGTVVEVDVKSRVLNVVSYGDIQCDRALMEIPEPVEEVSF